MKRLLPFAVVLAANVIALVQVARNRSGAPEARVELTERELRLAPLGDEDNGLAMRLVLPSSSRPPRTGDRVFPKETFVALDCRDPSGLSVVAMDADAAALRRSHPDRNRFMVTRAVARPGWSPHLQVSEIHVPLPYSRRLRGLAPTPAANNFQPRYRVTLCYGRDYDPWICDLTVR